MVPLHLSLFIIHRRCRQKKHRTMSSQQNAAHVSQEIKHLGLLKISCYCSLKSSKVCRFNEVYFDAPYVLFILFAFQQEMAAMQSKSSAHIATIKDKDLCIAKLQEEIRLLSG